ncbi:MULTISPECIES: phospholipase [Saccharothrix]|uniref:phospholipase n=1 Tax=Saccharothrix TaxID=2071 RepID=UPI0018E93DEC|nr:phospholipase [Saccharothrix sp. CB00851]
MTAIVALVLFGALGNTLPAQASAALGLGTQEVTAVPGVSEQKPDAAKRPVGPRSVAELANGSAIALRPQAAGKAPGMVESAREEDAGCTPYISGTITKVGLSVRIDYLAEVLCNFYLAGAGQAYLIERTSGSPYNGQVVAAATPFSFVNGYYGYSSGAVIIDGYVYDGGARMEIGFNLALRAYNGGIWTGCLALPNGLRYLSACSGLGTDTVSVGVGSGEVSTGLAPNRLAVLESLTSPGSASYDAWNIGRFYPDYAAYEFDWSTNYCSWAPDNPIGFTFESACARHDFGYRNYKAAQRFEANKARLDLAFYGDLQRVCATYPDAVRPACDALAKVYYEAAQNFGYLTATPERGDGHRVPA